MLTSIIFFH